MRATYTKIFTYPRSSPPSFRQTYAFRSRPQKAQIYASKSRRGAKTVGSSSLICPLSVLSLFLDYLSVYGVVAAILNVRSLPRRLGEDVADTAGYICWCVFLVGLCVGWFSCGFFV